MSKGRKDRPETLGEYVREQRERAGMSQRQLAAEAGVSFSNISRLESGFHAAPSPELLKSIADVLDIDLAELLAYRGIKLPGAARSLNIYLRRDYGLPEAGVEEAERAIQEIVKKYRRSESPSPES
jgi:transcriptional regulator with XRE-family HTH domain